MKDLIERLEAATGDFGVEEIHELSRALAAALFGPSFTISQHLLCRSALSDGIEAIGASLALVGEKLPGWFWSVRSPWDDETAFTAVLASSDYRDETWEAGDRVTTDLLSGLLVSAKAPTPALAVLIALLKALRALETK